MLCYSEIVVDPSCEELKICDGKAHIISNKPQLNTINIEGNQLFKVQKLVCISVISYLGIIGDESDIKKCLEAAPKILLTLKTLLNSICVNT